jgi:hypothetical protein
MQPEAKAHCVEGSPHDQLWPRVLRADTAHDFGALGSSEYVAHRGLDPGSSFRSLGDQSVQPLLQAHQPTVCEMFVNLGGRTPPL